MNKRMQIAANVCKRLQFKIHDLPEYTNSYEFGDKYSYKNSTKFIKFILDN